MTRFCGHLRVYHAAGLTEGVYTERVGACVFCEIKELKARNERIAAALDLANAALAASLDICARRSAELKKLKGE